MVDPSFHIQVELTNAWKLSFDCRSSFSGGEPQQVSKGSGTTRAEPNANFDAFLGDLPACIVRRKTMAVVSRNPMIYCTVRVIGSECCKAPEAPVTVTI